MDEIVKVMARGLIALPSDVRRKLGVKEGDILKVEVKDQEVVLRKEKRIYDLKGALSSKSPSAERKSFGEILAEELKRKQGEKG
ncbi:MAG TPA: AbrB/MazE/SpoVT family DNA-binding domain-containing protein [Aquifex aeolicus]|uniref:AbrB/MazE/SpoVT family DNA-binding domain-containing protein n=1 Tax=Aquifex aeolicus TaxID=63363 RepID=A0A7C5L7I7_AQUAO|nr:AbrB/MazE/SpoVT family DNA-binding domain-containing protein [Aquifex aeolicus]